MGSFGRYRLWVIGVGALIAAVFALAGVTFDRQKDEGRAPTEGRALRETLHAQAVRWVEEEALRRPDGYVYAVDVGQLAAYAARAGDRGLYSRLRQIIVEHLLVDEPDERETRGFIAWRYRPGRPVDASGTTEGLRAAEALWLGAAVFDRPEDRELAVKILHGYARHAWSERGVWLIRNYYNLGTDAYATNSYLVDYDPDFVAAVAEATDDPVLGEVARRSAELVRQAVSPAGLLRQVIQPELMTLMPSGGAIFSPNDMEQLSNAATVAERSARSCPRVAERVLAFAVEREDRLQGRYNASTGAAAGDLAAGPEALAPLIRLAVRLDRPEAVRTLLPRLIEQGWRFADRPYSPRAYVVSEVLLALQAVEGGAARR